MSLYTFHSPQILELIVLKIILSSEWTPKACKKFALPFVEKTIISIHVPEIGGEFKAVEQSPEYIPAAETLFQS